MQRGVYEGLVTTLTFVELLLYQQKNKLGSSKNDIKPKGRKGVTFGLILKAWQCQGSKIWKIGIKVWAKKKQNTFKNWPLKETKIFVQSWWKLSSHEGIIFTKFHKDWTKIVDFLLVTNFCMCLVFLPRLYDIYGCPLAKVTRQKDSSTNEKKDFDHGFTTISSL